MWSARWAATLRAAAAPSHRCRGSGGATGDAVCGCEAGCLRQRLEMRAPAAAELPLMGQADGFRAARPALTVSRSCRLALRGLALLLLRCSLGAGSGPGDGVRWATRRSLRGGRAGFCLEFGAGCFATDCLDKRLAVGVRDCYDRSSELLPVGPVIDVTFGESVSIRVVNRVQYTDSGDPSFYSSFPGCEPGDDIDLSALPANVSDNDYPGISIHWHGINQNGSQWYDGTAYFTQCPTVYGNELTYDFEINDKPGTYWYHAHVQDLASDGMQGALIIRERTSGVGTPGTCEDDWDKSLTNGEPVHELGPLTVIDWYNKSWLAIHNGLWNPDFKLPHRAQSLIFNGRGFAAAAAGRAFGDRAGRYLPLDPSDADCPRTESFQAAFTQLTVEPGKWYRLRVINQGNFWQQMLAIDGHSFYVIEADAACVDWRRLGARNWIPINLAQRYSLLFKADNPRGDRQTFTISFSTTFNRLHGILNKVLFNVTYDQVAAPCQLGADTALVGDNGEAISCFDYVDTGPGGDRLVGLGYEGALLNPSGVVALRYTTCDERTHERCGMIDTLPPTARNVAMSGPDGKPLPSNNGLIKKSPSLNSLVFDCDAHGLVDGRERLGCFQLGDGRDATRYFSPFLAPVQTWLAPNSSEEAQKDGKLDQASDCLYCDGLDTDAQDASVSYVRDSFINKLSTPLGVPSVSYPYPPFPGEPSPGFELDMTPFPMKEGRKRWMLSGTSFDFNQDPSLSGAGPLQCSPRAEQLTLQAQATGDDCDGAACSPTPTYSTVPFRGSPGMWDAWGNNETSGQGGWGQGASMIPFGTTVQITIQQQSYSSNLNAFNPVGFENHVFHMHGYHFYVLGEGPLNASYTHYKYDPRHCQDGTLNCKDPVLRDTYNVWQNGWAVIRFKADNPGFWFFHCHMAWHLTMGLATALFVERTTEARQLEGINFQELATLPDDIRAADPTGAGGGTGQQCRFSCPLATDDNGARAGEGDAQPTVTLTTDTSEPLVAGKRFAPPLEWAINEGFDPTQFNSSQLLSSGTVTIQLMWYDKAVWMPVFATEDATPGADPPVAASRGRVRIRTPVPRLLPADGAYRWRITFAIPENQAGRASEFPLFAYTDPLEVSNMHARPVLSGGGNRLRARTSTSLSLRDRRR